MYPQSPFVSPLQLFIFLDGQSAATVALNRLGTSLNETIVENPNFSHSEILDFNFLVFSSMALPSPASDGLHNLTVISTEQAFFDYVIYTYAFFCFSSFDEKGLIRASN